MSMKKIVLVFVLFFTILPVCAQLSDWQNINSLRWIRKMYMQNDNLWITTNGGIIKYNIESKEYSILNKANNSLPSNNVIAITCHDDDTWFGTKDKGFAKMRGNDIQLFNMTNTPLFNDQYIGCLIFDSNDNLWVGGLLNFYKCDGNNWTSYTTQNSALSSFITFDVLKFDDNGTLWFGGTDASEKEQFGYYTANEGVKTIVCDKYVNSIDIDADGNKWISTKYNGISKYDGKTMIHFTKENSDIPSDNTFALTIDKKGYIWFGSGDCLMKYDGINFTSYKVPVEKDDDYVSCLILDGSTVWLGTRFSGLFKFAEGKMEKVTIENNSMTTNTMTWSSAANSNGNVWIGTHDGLMYFDPNGKSSLLFQNRDSMNNRIAAVQTDKVGNAWIALNYSDTCLVKISGMDTTVYTTTNSPLVRGTINKICFDSQNHLWIGTDVGLYHYDGLSWRHYDTKNSQLKNNEIAGMAVDHNDVVWCGVIDNGLYRYDGTTWTNYNKDNSKLPSNLIRTLAVDSKNRLWMDSGEEDGWGSIGVEYGYGLTCFDGTNWITYNRSNSKIPSNTVMDITIDKNDNIWLCTFGDVGMTMFDGISNWTVYNVTNSGIANNDASKITIDSKRGMLWISHYNSAGISTAKMNSTSGIEDVQIGSLQNDVICDLTGRRIINPQKGKLYIRKGKKYILK